MYIAHLTLATPDAQTTANFYRAVFDWPIIERPKNKGPNGVWLQIGTNQQLHLVEVEGFQPSKFEGEFGRHWCINVGNAKFEAIVAALKSLDAVVIAPKRATKFRRLFFRDPIGYVIEVEESG